MNASPGAGVVIEAQILAPTRRPLQRGPAAGLTRLEISTTMAEVKRLISAYPSDYTPFLNPKSYGNVPGKNSASVAITLQLQQHQYDAQLKMPKSRLPDLLSCTPSKGAYLEPWIPCGPVINSHRLDVKLSGALRHAGFNVPLWTRQVVSLGPPVRPYPLQSVEFLVQGKTWTLLTNPNPIPIQPSRPPNLEDK